MEMRIKYIVFWITCLVPLIGTQDAPGGDAPDDAPGAGPGGGFPPGGQPGDAPGGIPDPEPEPNPETAPDQAILNGDLLNPTTLVPEEESYEDEKTRDNYTFMALIDIVFTDGCRRTCTGAIIHDNVVITAAHCFTMVRNAFLLPELSLSFIVIGTKLMFDTGYEQYLPIERVLTHPQFKGWTADIALVFTFANMMSDKPGQVLPLASDKSSTPVDSNVTVLSWGRCKGDADEDTDVASGADKKRLEGDAKADPEVHDEGEATGAIDGPTAQYNTQKEDGGTDSFKKMRGRHGPSQTQVKPFPPPPVPPAGSKQGLRTKIDIKNSRKINRVEKPVEVESQKRAHIVRNRPANKKSEPEIRRVAADNQNMTTKPKESRKYQFRARGDTLLESGEESIYAQQDKPDPRKLHDMVVPSYTPIEAQNPGFVSSMSVENQKARDTSEPPPGQPKPEEEDVVNMMKLIRLPSYRQKKLAKPTWSYRKMNSHNNKKSRRYMPLSEGSIYKKQFKGWRRSIGQMQNNLTVGIFGYVNLASCKKLVERALPPLYAIKNKQEVLCYSSEEFYITNEDSGAPVVQGNELIAVTVGGVDSEGEHVAVGMKISCFCSWIADNLPNGGGKNMSCCKDCCSDFKQRKNEKFRSHDNNNMKVKLTLPRRENTEATVRKHPGFRGGGQYIKSYNFAQHNIARASDVHRLFDEIGNGQEHKEYIYATHEEK